MGRFLRPRSLPDALAALASAPYTVLAGGTDFYPARVGRRVEEDVLDITGVDELRGIRHEGADIRIGALATWSDVLRADLPAWCHCVRLAAREVGGVQVQNAGTVAGNLCNASPAADGIPALMALGAQVELSALDRRRVVPLTDFVLGNRRTQRSADELVTGVLVPKWGARDGHHARSTFLKLGARRYLVISIVMVAAAIEISPSGKITRCGVAVGACAPVAKRLPTLEKAMLGQRLTGDIADLVTPTSLVPLAPIDDVRGTAAYRTDAALELVRRALAALAGPGGIGDWA